MLNVYTHPKSKTDFRFIEKIAKLRKNKMICVGDLNATNTSWFCPSTNKRGKELENMCFNNDIIIDFFTSKFLRLNEKKCTYTVFTNKLNDLVQLLINNHVLDYSANLKALGIYFDPKLKFNFHFLEIKKKLITKINLLRILSNKSNRLNVKHLLTIFKSLILSNYTIA
jgi:hypothetical protein